MTDAHSNEVRIEIDADHWITLDQAVNVIAFGDKTHAAPSLPPMDRNPDSSAIASYPRELINPLLGETRVVGDRHDEMKLGVGWYATSPNSVKASAYSDDLRTFTADRAKAAELLFKLVREGFVEIRGLAPDSHSSAAISPAEFALPKALGRQPNTIDYDFEKISEARLDDEAPKLMEADRRPLWRDVVVNGRQLAKRLGATRDQGSLPQDHAAPSRRKEANVLAAIDALWPDAEWERINTKTRNSRINTWCRENDRDAVSDRTILRALARCR
jgi:hypothetical protein